jgi:tetratricopeptide (TPR) repeat protein
MGVRAYYEGSWDEAAEHYRRAEEAALRAGDVLTGAHATNNRAEILLDQGHLAAAAQDFDSALRTYRAAKFTVGEVLVGVNLGRLAAAEGRFADAHEQFADAVRRFTDLGSRSMSLEADARRAEAFVLEGRHLEAADLARATLAGMTETGEIGTRTALLERLLGWASVQGRQPEGAWPHFDESLRVARELGAQYEIARTLRARADAGLGSDEDAQTIFDRLGVVRLPAVPLP